MLLSAHSLHAQFTNDDVTQRRAFFAPTPRTHFHLKSVLTHSLCSLNITVYIMCRVWCLQSRSLATSDFDCKSTSSKCTLSYTAVKTSKFTAFLPLLCTVKHFMQWVHYKNPVNVPYLAANQIVALSVQLIDFSLSTIKKKAQKNPFNHRNYIWQNIINRVTWHFICKRPTVAFCSFAPNPHARFLPVRHNPRKRTQRG